MSRLSSRMKVRLNPFLDKRDGILCLYCKAGYTVTNPYIYEHLNNDDNDSRPENIIKAHQTCNCRKKYSEKMLAIALGKLKMNEASKLVCAGMKANTGTEKDVSSCVAINRKNKPITIQFLHEWTSRGEELLLKDAVDAITNQCYIQNGSGSQTAIYSYIDSLCNSYTGLFTIYSNPQGKNCIRRRTEN